MGDMRPSTATGEAFVHHVGGDVAAVGYRLDVARPPRSWHGALTETVSSIQEGSPPSITLANLRRSMGAIEVVATETS